MLNQKTLTTGFAYFVSHLLIPIYILGRWVEMVVRIPVMMTYPIVSPVGCSTTFGLLTKL